MNPQAEFTQAQIWWLAARPKTLPAAAAPVLAGTASAAARGHFDPIPFLAALLGALFIQIGTNLANDLFDFAKGADTAERLGPLRVTQAGLLTTRQVRRGMWTAFGGAALFGVVLIYYGGWPIAAIGLLSILAGIAYTGGPYPLGYHGLGEVFVFLFFGLAAVGGSYYVQVGVFDSSVLWTGAAIGSLAAAILVVNNLRDLATDAKAGKRTLAVRFGERAARIEYLILLISAYSIAIVRAGSGGQHLWLLLVLVTLPRAIRLIGLVFRATGKPLNAALAGTGRLELEFSILFGIGLLIG